MAEAADQGVRIGLSVVVMTLKDRKAVVLTTQDEEGQRVLPFGPFDPARDRTFERALRDFVTEQTGFRLGFVEQLYTFGDAGRGGASTLGRQRDVSVGYLALTSDAAEGQTHDARWDAVLDVFPWEDRRTDFVGLNQTLVEGLTRWAGGDERRWGRVRALFALGPEHRWNEERVLERYELLYEARLVAEAWRDARQTPPDAVPLLPGVTMGSDHRRILATGLGRLRSKLKYRPVLFDLMPRAFTLSELQTAAEAVSGLSLHKQNFRRGVERTGLVQPTGRLSAATGGRPAELFRVIDGDLSTGEALGLPLPAQR